MHSYSHTDGGEGMGFVIKWAAEGLEGRCCARLLRRAEKVQCDFYLFQHDVPKIEREAWMCASQSGDEVVLEGSDCSLCSIGSMDIRRNILNGDTCVFAGGFDFGGCLIVHVKSGESDAKGREEFQRICERTDVLLCCSVLHRLQMYVVVLIRNQYEDIVVSRARLNREAASEVHEELRVDWCEDEMCLSLFAFIDHGGGVVIIGIVCKNRRIATFMVR